MEEQQQEQQQQEQGSPVSADDVTQQTVEVPGEPQQAPQEAPKETEQQQQPSNPEWFKPDAFQLKYRGQTVSPKDYNHAVQLMQQGWSYNEAMRALKGEREELEKTKGKYDQYAQLDQALQKNPAFAQRIWQMYQEAQSQRGAAPVQQQPGQPGPDVSGLYQTVQTMQERLQSIDKQRADAEVQREVEDVKSKLPDVQWDQVTESGHTLMYDILNHAYQHKFPNLMSAARDYLWDSREATAKMKGAQSAAEAKRRAAQQGVVQPRDGQSGSPQPRRVNVSDVSYDQLAEMALKKHGIT